MTVDYDMVGRKWCQSMLKTWLADVPTVLGGWANLVHHHSCCSTLYVGVSLESWEESTVSIPRNVYKREKTSLQKWPLASCPTVIVILFSFTCRTIALPVGLRWNHTCLVCRLVQQFLWIIVVASVYAGNLLTPSLGAMWSLLSCCSIRGENHCL